MTDSAAPGLGSFVNIFDNIALLFPLGLFLPLFWRWFERAGRTIGWCFGTSLSIELIQLVAGGVASADDLLLNTLGGKAADKSVPQARADRRGESTVGVSARVLAGRHRGEYNIRSAGALVGAGRSKRIESDIRKQAHREVCLFGCNGMKYEANTQKPPRRAAY